MAFNSAPFNNVPKGVCRVRVTEKVVTERSFDIICFTDLFNAAEHETNIRRQQHRVPSQVVELKNNAPTSVGSLVRFGAPVIARSEPAVAVVEEENSVAPEPLTPKVLYQEDYPGSPTSAFAQSLPFRPRSNSPRSSSPRVVYQVQESTNSVYAPLSPRAPQDETPSPPTPDCTGPAEYPSSPKYVPRYTPNSPVYSPVTVPPRSPSTDYSRVGLPDPVYLNKSDRCADFCDIKKACGVCSDCKVRAELSNPAWRSHYCPGAAVIDLVSDDEGEGAEEEMDNQEQERSTPATPVATLPVSSHSSPQAKEEEDEMDVDEPSTFDGLESHSSHTEAYMRPDFQTHELIPLTPAPEIWAPGGDVPPSPKVRVIMTPRIEDNFFPRFDDAFQSTQQSSSQPTDEAPAGESVQDTTPAPVAAEFKAPKPVNKAVGMKYPRDSFGADAQHNAQSRKGKRKNSPVQVEASPTKKIAFNLNRPFEKYNIFFFYGAFDEPVTCGRYVEKPKIADALAWMVAGGAKLVPEKQWTAFVQDPNNAGAKKVGFVGSYCKNNKEQYEEHVRIYEAAKSLGVEVFTAKMIGNIINCPTDSHSARSKGPSTPKATLKDGVAVHPFSSPCICHTLTEDRAGVLFDNKFKDTLAETRNLAFCFAARKQVAKLSDDDLETMRSMEPLFNETFMSNQKGTERQYATPAIEIPLTLMSKQLPVAIPAENLIPHQVINPNPQPTDVEDEVDYDPQVIRSPEDRLWDALMHDPENFVPYCN